jgi:serine/threonine-protein kinase
VADLRERLQEALADCYHLDHELGRGGMATVYLARDLKHDRPVALKVMHPELAATVGPERFLREVRTTARLQHPHILPVHDSGEAAGQLWYSMPLVEGESLRDRLKREIQLPVEEAVRLTAEVAEALDYAHGQGVIHRDIKPENILLSRGHALVADFGVAKAIAGGGAQLTETGMALGTAAYMAPEQAGDGPVDARSDVYSLGCVLYELLAGEPPFTGRTPQAIIAKRILDPVPSVRRLREVVPEEVEQVLARALAKVPADRFATAGEFAHALTRPIRTSPRAVRLAGGQASRRLATLGALALVLVVGALVVLRLRIWPAGLTRDPNALAVLPFRVSDPTLALWREGLVDLFATDLDGAAQWRTIHPRTVLSRWHRTVRPDDEGDEATLMRVAQELGAGYALTGSLAGGTRVRLALELHSTAGGEPFRLQAEAPADSIPGLVDQLSIALVRERFGSDTTRSVPNIGRVTTNSLPALKAYLAGEQKFRHARPRGAIPDFRRAVELDSSFALALYRLSAAEHWTLSPHDIGPDEHLDRAVRLKGRLSPRDALLVRGTWESGQNWPEGFATLAEVTQRYPDDAEAWFAYGDAHFHLAKQFLQPFDTFREALSRSIALDPGFGPSYLHLTEDAFERGDSVAARRYIEALERIDSAGPKAVGFRLAYDLVWGDELARRSVREKLPGTSTDALITGKHGINFAPELAESTLVLAQAIAADPKRAVDDRINAEIGVLWVHFYRGRVRAAIATFDTIARLAREAGPTSRFAYWAGGAPRWAGAVLVTFGYTTDTARVRHWARQEAVGFDHYKAGAVGARLHDPVILRRSVDTLRGYIDTDPPQGDSLDRVAYARANQWGQTTASGLLGLEALFRGDSVRALRLLQVAADSLRAIGLSGPFFTGPLDLEIGKLLVTGGDAGAAEPHLLAATGVPWLSVLAEWHLGRAAEQRGDRAAALERYGRVVRWWRDCDPELRPWWDQMRQALARVEAMPVAQR